MSQQFRNQLRQLSRNWIDQGLPTRDGIIREAAKLEQWRHRKDIRGLWLTQPLMITATLDDGMGHGLAIIERFASVMGITVEKMGLLQDPETIIKRCRERIPDFLGLTVLQLDSDDDLTRVSLGIPKKACLIAGGAAFRYDPELADRCRVGFVAINVAFFIDFILRWSPSGR